VAALGRGLGDQQVEDEAPSPPLSLGDVARVLDELGELRVGYGVGIDPERGEGDLAYRALAVLEEAHTVVGTHSERSAGEVNESFFVVPDAPRVRRPPGRSVTMA
jgi:hypothetical protein